MNLHATKDAAVASVVHAAEKSEQLQLLQIRIKENLSSLPGLVKLTRLKVWDVGTDLKKVRSLLKEDSGWVEFLDGFELSQRTLYNYIQVSEKFSREEVENLPINVTGLIELAQPATPVEAISAVMESPKPLTTGEVKKTIQEFKLPVTPQEVTEHFKYLGDMFTPTWDMLISLYQQIGKVRVGKNSKGGIIRFSVERDDLGAPFPMVVNDRQRGWMAWQRDAAKWLNLVCSKPEMGVLNSADLEPVVMRFQQGDRIAPYWNPDQEMKVLSITDGGLYEARSIENTTVLYLNEEMAISFGHPEPIDPIDSGRSRLPQQTITVPTFEPEPEIIIPVRERMENDFYPTPDKLTQGFLELADLKIKGKVFEPCVGAGAIAKFFPGCITNDPFPSGGYDPHYLVGAENELLWEIVNQEHGGIDWVVTNPPYNSEILMDIINLAWENSKVGMVLLLRLSFLEPCGDRADWLKANADHMTHLIPVSPRPPYRADTSGRDSMTSMFCVWQKDWSWKKKGISSPFKFLSNWR